jgi:hypothetical protein
MLLKYWEKHQLTRMDWQQELASMGVDKSPAMEVIERSLGEKGETIVSVYLFGVPRSRPGRDFIRGEYSLGAVG